MPYPYLEAMPVDDLFELIDTANEIQRLRDIETDKKR